MIVVHLLDRYEGGAAVAVCKAVGVSLTVTRDETGVTCSKCRRRADGQPRIRRPPRKPQLVDNDR